MSSNQNQKLSRLFIFIHFCIQNANRKNVSFSRKIVCDTIDNKLCHVRAKSDICECHLTHLDRLGFVEIDDNDIHGMKNHSSWRTPSTIGKNNANGENVQNTQ